MALGGNDEAGGHGSGQLMPSSRGDIGAHYPGPINEPSAKAQPERLVSQKQAAAFLHVSQTYLRASSCPKVLLPGNGPKDRHLVRYRLTEVAAWSEQWTQRATVPQRRAV
jgi:hypothetical protein